MKKMKKLSIVTVVLISCTLLLSSVFAEIGYLARPGKASVGLVQAIDPPAQTGESALTKTAAVSQPVVNSETEKTITLLATADIHGRIYAYDYAVDAVDPAAGFAKIQTLIKQEKAKNPQAILMDVGDTVQDNSAELFNDLPVHPMVQSLNKMGFDTWTLGNHEFNFEKAFLDRNVAAFKGAVLAANIYKEDGSRYVKPYTIIEKDGVRVAIVGLITPHVPRWEASSPEHFQGLSFTELVDEAKQVVKELAGQYDVLVGAFHEGREGEYGHAGIKAVAEACPEFAVIFGGHEHAKFDNLEVNGVKLIEPGAYGWALAKADIRLEKQGNAWKVTDVATKNIETAPVAEDPEILKTFEFVHKKSVEDANVVIGKVTEDFVKNVDYITGSATVTTMPTTQIEDTALIDLINEVQLYYTEADVSAAAAFKNDMNLLAGEFKKKNVADIYKYTNTLMAVNISGANLKKYMEWSAGYYNTSQDGDVTISFNPNVRSYNYDMFAGVTYDIDISKPAGSRIVNAAIDEAPIDDHKLYKLAVNNYRFGTLTGLELVTEDDVYFDSYKLWQDSGRIRDLIGKYIRDQKNGRVTPSCDHNWKIIGFDFNHPLRDTVFDLIKKGEITIPASEDGRTPNVKSVNSYDLAKAGKLTMVDILFFNDFHGSLAEDVSASGKNVGMSKLVTAVREAVAENPNTIIVSGGDNYQGTAMSNLTYGAPVSEMMKAMEVLASAVGNHEFDWGADRMQKWAKDGNFTFLASNIYDSKTGKPVKWAKPYLITQKSDLKIAFIGLAHPDTPTLTKAEYVTGIEFRDPAASAQGWINYLKAGKASEGKPDLIIALTHLDSYQDAKTGEITGNAADLCKEVKGLDGVISAHSHLTVSGTVNKVPVVQAYYNGRALGKLSIIRDAAGKTIAVTPSVKQLSAIKNNIIPNTAATEVYQQYQEKLAPILGENLGTAGAEFTHDRSTKGTVTLLGKWSCDVMRAKTGVQVGIQNGGGLRRSLREGAITMGDLYEIMPFDNYLVTLELPGADLKKAIDHGINHPTITDGQFSGLKVTYDPDAPQGDSIVTITLEDGTPIRDDQYYSVVINDFMLTGGDKYDFSRARNVVNTYIPVRDALVEAIKDAKVLTPVQSDYIAPSTEPKTILKPAA